jgi:hypothetical protein
VFSKVGDHLCDKRCSNRCICHGSSAGQCIPHRSRWWGPVSDELHIDPKTDDLTVGGYLQDAHRPINTIPSMQEAHNDFRRDSLNEARRGIWLYLLSKSSVFLRKLPCNGQLDQWTISTRRPHQHVVLEAELDTRYMIEQITNAPLADLQGIFFDLVQERTKTILLANHSRGYESCKNCPTVAPAKGAIFEREWILRHGYFPGGGSQSLPRLAWVLNRAAISGPRSNKLVSEHRSVADLDKFAWK